MSTFHGLEMAKQALFTQQSALYTTGHNISNANTEGYSRQRVNFETLPAYPTGSRNRPQIPGQIGTGVQAGSVERVRNSFLDLQYRAENTKNGYWKTASESLYRMESLLNEPSDSGLANTMDKFWQSLQDLATNPENDGARSVVVQRGVAVADTFNYLTKNIESMQSDIRHQIDNGIEDVNSVLKRISEINDSIKRVEPHGYLPNDLYDERDVLIDKLSGMVNIKVERVKTSDSSLDIADGLSKISLVNDDGSTVELVNPENEPGYQKFHLDEDADVNEIKIGTDGNYTIDFAVSASNGSLSSLVNLHGYGNASSPGAVNSDSINFNNMLNSIQEMAQVFKEAFNEVHQGGLDLAGNQGIDFFNIDANNVMSVNSAIVDDPALVAASSDGTIGNGENAKNLADVMDSVINGDPLGKSATVKSFYGGLIGSLGVATQEANRMNDNTDVLRSQVEEQRKSVSSVSLDEEMTNMIKFQQSYNAAARSMTAMDEILDRIINNMGLVGR